MIDRIADISFVAMVIGGVFGFIAVFGSVVAMYVA